MEKKVNLLISINDDYIEQAECLLYSLKKYNKDTFFNVFLFYDGITQNNLTFLEDFIKDNNIGILNKYLFKSDILNFPINIGYTTKETYFRLFAPFIIEEKIDKILYLDCDIICNGSIDRLYNMDFEKNIIIGCKNMSSVDDGDTSINSGVLLIDIAKYKETISMQEIVDYINENGNSIKNQEQDVINKLLLGKIKKVDNKYNYQVNQIEFFEESSDNNILIHFSTWLKPWSKDFFDEPSKKKFLSIYNEVKEINYKKYSLDIIVPIYNSRDYLLRLLSSLYIQEDISFFNIYLIDDCSDESYDDIINIYKNKLNINYIKLPNNMGPGVSREVGLSNSSANYVLFIDSDDILYDVWTIKSLLRQMPGHDVVRSIVVEKQPLGYDERIYDNYSLHGKIYKRSFLENKDIHFNDELIAEDVYFNVRVDLSGADYYDYEYKSYLFSSNDNSLTGKDKKYNIDTYLIAYSKALVSAVEDSLCHISDIEIFTERLFRYLVQNFNNMNYSKSKRAYEKIDKSFIKISELIKNNSDMKILKSLLEENNKLNDYFKKLI